MSEKGKNILIAILIVIITVLVAIIIFIEYRAPLEVYLSQSNESIESIGSESVQKIPSTSFKVIDSCANIYNCMKTINLGSINDKKLMATFNIKMSSSEEEPVDSVIINGKIVNGDVMANITEVGIYRGKYIVIVKERSDLQGLANKIVEYYDENLIPIKTVEMAEDLFEIDSSVYDYYSCKTDNQYIQNRMVINEDGEFSTSVINIENRYCASQGEY